ncbi:hypothetical protein DPX16_19970 [Anabarilius grahami]|uniref:Uncharacterized protein n=1 Tax=Anabarilius grahami TaxID=495550 RepID=A0A3N0XP97_ANAGA|nr:hypothetical protein DPX16_19970 [Anabarilius grahami]
MKRSIEEFGVGDRRSSILVLALWPYHRGLLSDSIPAGELRGKEFCGVPNKSHEQEQGQVFLTVKSGDVKMIAFLSRANPFKRPKSLASLYLLCQQQLSTTHRTVYQSGSSLKRVISTLMAHKSETSTASFSGTSSSFQRVSGEHSSKGFGLGLAER